MNKDVIIALDFQTKEEVINFLKPFTESAFVKVGMELFYSEGPEIVREIKRMGHKIFLDLKFHDIPNTVAGATRSIMKLDVDIANVHASGTKKMMEAAANEIKKSESKMLMIAVTQLTSTDEETMKKDLLINDILENTVLHYAKNAKESGMNGIVCSALEVPAVKKALGEDFICVTPGIRKKDNSVGDQARVVTPEDARKLGSDFIVVGRPITKSENPFEAYKEFRAEFLGK